MMRDIRRIWLIVRASLMRQCWWLALAGTIVSLAIPAWADDSVVGTWQGRYFCGQGETALTLTIRPANRESEVSALFHFQSSSANPGVPEGCFTMVGSFNRATQKLSLSAGRWLLHPANYVTVDLAGQLEPDGRRLSGQVVGPLCTRFDLRRVTPPLVASAGACISEAAIASID